MHDDKRETVMETVVLVIHRVLGPGTLDGAAALLTSNAVEIILPVAGVSLNCIAADLIACSHGTAGRAGLQRSRRDRQRPDRLNALSHEAVCTSPNFHINP